MAPAAVWQGHFCPPVPAAGSALEHYWLVPRASDPRAGSRLLLPSLPSVWQGSRTAVQA